MKKIITISIAIFCLLTPVSAFAEKVGGGDLTFTPKNARPVVFSHEKHVIGRGLKCSGCHFRIFEMSHGSYKTDMAKITKNEACGKCHNGQKAFDAKDKKNCERCHRP